MVDKDKIVVIATGGSGGHMFPAAGFAETVLRKGYGIAMITDERGATFQGIFANNPLYKIRASSPRGDFMKLVTGIYNLGIGFCQAFKILGKIKPSAVVAFGGYASVPTVIAALVRRIPVVIHEQNAILGGANRFTARFARIVALSFKETKLIPKSAKTVYVGMPVRPNIKKYAQSPYPDLQDGTEFRILVFGGSQGSKIFSLVVPSAMSFLDDGCRKRVNIVEQCRVQELESARKIYEKAGIKYLAAPFFDDMEERIRDAHLLICRAGASTIAEATVIGRPMVMIPLKISRDGDQAANAANVKAAGAGWIIEEDNFNPSEIKKIVEYLMNNPVFLKEAAHNAMTLGVTDADDKLADIVIKEFK